MDFKAERLKAHNDWPTKILLKAEIEFEQHLRKNELIPFFTLPMTEIKQDELFSLCVGHLTDGLEALPYRPDYMFDHCFRVIDKAMSKFFSGKGIKGVVQGMGNLLIQKDKKEWTEIINACWQHAPVTTKRYIVKRMLAAYETTDDNLRHLEKRTEDCMGKDRYREWCAKFGAQSNRNDSGQETEDNHQSEENIFKAVGFLSLYLSGKKGTRSSKASHQLLDLTDDKNVPSAQARIEFLLSIYLFSMRNDRAHGVVLSPFRTSKARIQRYQSYYFAMTCAYIFSLGAILLLGKGGISSNDILDCAKNNFKAQNEFFRAAQPSFQE